MAKLIQCTHAFRRSTTPEQRAELINRLAETEDVVIAASAVEVAKSGVYNGLSFAFSGTRETVPEYAKRIAEVEAEFNAEPEVAEPEVAEPEAAEPEPAEPEPAEPEAAEPEPAEPEPAEPEAAEPEPEPAEAAEPEAPKPKGRRRR